MKIEPITKKQIKSAKTREELVELSKKMRDQENAFHKYQLMVWKEITDRACIIHKKNVSRTFK